MVRGGVDLYIFEPFLNDKRWSGFIYICAFLNGNGLLISFGG